MTSISVDIKEEKERKKCCGNCEFFHHWLSYCSADEDGIGNPLKYNFRNGNFGKPDGLCDLHIPKANKK